MPRHLALMRFLLVMRCTNKKRENTTNGNKIQKIPFQRGAHFFWVEKSFAFFVARCVFT
jgi:hypothetical protein